MSKSVLQDVFQQYIHKSKYARWKEDEKRREDWHETVDRYINFFQSHLENKFKYKVPDAELKRVSKAILNLDVMPSMRGLMTAGPALERDNGALYNCAFMVFDKKRKFDELMYILMCGSGVGFSVERQYINKLPVIADDFYHTQTTIHVADSKTGWAASFKELISLLYAGQIPKWDLSKVRPTGARLKTFGGVSSGPGPLEDLFKFTIDTFRSAAGRKLNSIEVHDIACKIGETIVVGGVRRSALISLSNLSDPRMREAKSGQWWQDNGQRSMANNSVAYTEKPDIGIFLEEWLSLYRSKSGERGIFNRTAIQNKTKSLPKEKRDHELVVGTNPCSEIILRDDQFCNLSSVVLRPQDTLEDVLEKVRIATVLGTWQASVTDFKYISSSWRKNCEEEALLGVSMTGIMDHPMFNNYMDKNLPERLTDLREYVIEVNAKLSKKIGINPAAATTCVKPEGTTSSLVGSSSGIHARHSEYYIRTVRGTKADPLCAFLVEIGIPVEDDATNPSTGYVFSFPIKSPDKAIVRKDLSAIDQLELWKIYQDHWCEHKPSITVTVKENEWISVAEWVYKHFDEISGVSFLPYSDHTYRQAPFQEVTKEEYEKFLKKMPTHIEWNNLCLYEEEDNTKGSQTYSCTGPEGCEIL